MPGFINQALNLVKGYRRLWILIPIFALVAFAVSQWVLRSLHDRDIQYGSREQIARILLEVCTLRNVCHFL